MDEEVKKILEKKFGKQTTRTGGKGSKRRKNLNKKSKINSTHLSNEEKDFSKILNEINKMIEDIENTDNIELWNIYITEYFGDFLFESKKKYFTKDNIFVDINDENDERFDLFMDNIFEEINDKLEIKYCYEFLKKNLSSSGYESFKYYLDDIPEILTKEMYIPDSDTEEDTNNIDVNNLLSKLDLSSDEIPSKETLRKAFFKKSTKLHPDKHPDEVEKYTILFTELNKTYQTLSEYYYPKKKINEVLD